MIYLPGSSFDNILKKNSQSLELWKDAYFQEELVSLVKKKNADHKNLYTEVFDKLIKDVAIQKEIMDEGD